MRLFVYKLYWSLSLSSSSDLVSEYQQYQEATADDDDDEEGYDNGYDDEVQEDDSGR